MNKIIQKIGVGLLLTLFIATTFATPIVQGFSFPKEYDLVAILVEQGIYQQDTNGETYVGLTNTVRSRFLQQIPQLNMKQRIDRYAQDLQNTLPGTRTVMIQVDRYEKPENVRSVLQRLYFDGDPDPAHQDTNAKLKGVVIVGEVPLPVVLKGDNRFISLFPYTDLENSAYVFNEQKQEFELNSKVTEPRVEAWHGVIRPPVTTQKKAGMELLAAYFDKNHLFHMGDNAYANFNRKVFFQDFFAEAKSIDPTAYKSYEAFLDHQDDVVYNRYTKKLFQELTAAVGGEIDAANEAAASAKSELEAAGVEFDNTQPPRPDIPPPPEPLEGAPPNEIPDIQTLFAKMSDNLMKPYDQIFSKYPNLVNDFIRYTGRYVTPQGEDYKLEADSSVNLIAVKDTYVSNYLRYVNDMVEKKVDEVVNQVQKNIPITKIRVRVSKVHTNAANGSGNINLTPVTPFTTSMDDPLGSMNTALTIGGPAVRAALALAGGVGAEEALRTALDPIMQELDRLGFHGPDSPNADAAQRSYDVKYINYSPAVTINDLAYFPKLWPSYPLADSAYERDSATPTEQITLPAHINGVRIDKDDAKNQLWSAQQCSTYLGSLGEGDLSKLVEANRALDVKTGLGTTDDKWFPGLTETEAEQNNGEGKQCFGRLNGGSCEAYEHFGGCYFDGSYLYNSPATLDGTTKFQGCYPDHATDPILDPAGTRRILPENEPLAGYDSYYACLNFRPEETLYRHRINIDQILETLDNDDQLHDRPEILATVRDIVGAGDSKLKIINPDPLPQDQKLAESVAGVRFTLTLADVLKGIGWNPVSNAKGWKTIFADFLLNNGPGNPITVRLNHPVLDQATIVLSQEDVLKEISSVRTHKEPTNETLSLQQRNFIATDLPVDQPRYVSFQNQNKALKTIVYPDAFKAKNLEEYVQSLKAIEAILNSQPLPVGQNGPACVNCLTDLIKPVAETSVFQNGATVIQKANQFKVADALAWKELDLDSKHVYVSETFIDATHSGFIDEAKHSYEIAYFNGEGDTSGYDLGFNKALSDSPFAEQLPEAPASYNDDPSNPFDDPPPDDYEDGYLLWTWSPPPISPWMDRVSEWARDIKNGESLDLSVSFGAEKDKKDAEIAEQNEKDLAALREQSLKEIAQPDQTDLINRSRITKLTLEADSLSAVVGKKVSFEVSLRDAQNKVVADEFSRVTLVTDKPVKMITPDDDPTTDGAQIAVTNGSVPVAFVAPDQAQTIEFTIKLNGQETIGSKIKFNILQDAQLKLVAASTAVIADGRAQVPVEVTAVDSAGRVLGDVNGTVRIGISDETLGSAVKTVDLRQGRARLIVKGGVKKGEITLYATLSNLNPGSVTIKLLPGVAVKLALTKNAENLVANPDAVLEVNAQIFDAYNNLIDTNTGTQVQFALSAGADDLVQLSSDSALTAAGGAVVRLLPKGKSGSVTVTARAAGLREATIAVDVVKKFGVNSLTTMVPETLVAALLGIPAGNVAAANPFGSHLVFSGKTQAVTTLTTSPKQYGSVFEVNDRGVLNADASRVSVSFIPGNHLAFLLRDTRFGVDLAKVSLITKKDTRFEVTTQSDPEKLSDGIYIRKVATDSSYVVDTKRGALRVVKDDEERIEVQTNGYVKVLDQDFTVRPKLGAYLTLEVMDGATVVAEVYMVQRFNQDVRLIKTDNEISNDAAGVYVKQFALPNNFFFTPTFTGNTTASSLGLALKDRSIVTEGAGAPGFGYNSFEDSLDKPGVGFTQDNKFALLFASGEAFGEANREYMSDATIVLGDPTIKLGESPRNGENFSADTGSLLYAASNIIKGIVPFDVNSDGRQDLLVVESNDTVRYLHNAGGIDQFDDRGVILNIKNGIQDYTTVDINSDGQMDFVVATQNGCKVDDTCLDIFINNYGAFARQNISFEQSEKILTVKAADMNGDERPELIMVDTAGDISMLVQGAQGFSSARQVIGNVGLKTDSSRNLLEGILVRYAGIVEKDPSDPTSVEQYEPLQLTEPNTDAIREAQKAIAQAGTQIEFDASQSFHQVQYDFMKASAPSSLLRFSSKYAQDVNGGVLRSGDIVRYTINLQNISNTAISRIALSDILAQQLTIKNESIRCIDCAQNEMKIVSLQGDVSRPVLLTNITVPANGHRTITYEAVFSQTISTAEKVSLDIRANFSDSNVDLQAKFDADELPDIAINKSTNPSGMFKYLVSKKLPNGSVSYTEETSSPESAQATALPPANQLASEATVPPSDDQTEAMLEQGQQQLTGLQTKDSDGDGLQDSIDKINGRLEKVGDVMQAGLNKLTCDAGCIALPINASFLTPGFFSVMGVPGTFDYGYPVFAWGIPSLVPTWPPTPPQAGPAPASAAAGRVYLSPTLTGGLGFAVCTGPYGTGPLGIGKNCYAYGISPLSLLPMNICDKINGGVQGVLSKAAEVVNDAQEGLTAALNKKPPSGSGSGGGGLLNYSFGSYEAPIVTNKHVKVPGFPGILTDWWAAQIEEIVDKATDLPDLYVIYPKVDSIVGSVVPTESFGRTGDTLTNVLSYINSIPLIDIQTNEVTFKVPIITEKEIAKAKADAYQWVEDEKLELERWKQQMQCFIPDRDVDNPDPNQNPEFLNMELCKFVDVEMNKLINSVIENARRIDEWTLFPKKVLQWRTVKSYYIQQVIGYVDTVIEFIGGWTQRNVAIVKQWRRSVREMQDMIEHYKLLVDIMIKANSACDKCTTERYGLDELILKIFAAIPKPPVIPLPKLPDLVVDVSKIQAGITVQWPDVHFAPEPFIIPKLPRIHLGVNLTIPLFKVQIPEIPLIPPPPDLPQLPQLPPMQLGKLPDLPPAPKLPPLPGALTATIDVLRQLLRIYCIVKLGLTPVDELLLKTRIEQITARGLTPLLPIDLKFAFPGLGFSITYVDQIVVTAYVNLKKDVTYIQDVVDKAAEKANKFTNELVKKVNKYTENLSRSIEKYTSPTIDVNINKDGVDTKVNGKKINKLDQYVPALKEIFGPQVTSVEDAQQQVASLFDSLQTASDSYTQQVAQIPTKQTITAEPISLQAAREQNVAYAQTLNHARVNEAIAAHTDDERLPLIDDLIAYRDSLKSYNENKGTQITSLADLVATSSPRMPESPTKKYLASTTTPTVSNEPQKIAPLMPVDSRLAQLPNIPDPNAPGNGGPGGSGSVDMTGIFYNDSHGNGRRLVNYTLEADSENHLAEFDPDKDGDADKVYSYGQNLFIKKNYRSHKAALTPEVFRSTDIEYWTVFQLLKDVSTPRDLRVSNETAHASTLEFSLPEVSRKAIVGFDVESRPSLEGFNSDDDRSAKFVTRYVVQQQAVAVPAATEGIESAVGGDAAVTIPAGEKPIGSLQLVEGLVKVNGEPAQESRPLKRGEYVEVGDNASAQLVFVDGTQMTVEENSSFVVPQGAAFELQKGAAELVLPKAAQSNSQPGALPLPTIFTAGTTLSVTGGELGVGFDGGSHVRLLQGAKFDIPALTTATTVLSRVSAKATIHGAEREYISSSTNIYHLNAGDKLHAMGTAVVTWATGSSNAVEYRLTNAFLTVQDSEADGIDIEVTDGKAEVIKVKKQGVTTVESGAALLDGEKVVVETGAVIVDSFIGQKTDELSDDDARRTVLRAGQSLALNSLDSIESPSLTMNLDEGFYFARINSILHNGTRAVSSGTALLAPQLCGDRSLPYANAGANEITVSVGKELTLDAGRSFDADGEIVEYRFDTNLAVDSSGDGVKDNDVDIKNPQGVSRFVVGPFTEVGDIEMRLTVLDEAHNQGTQNVTVHVVKPTIILEPGPLSENIITGHVEPREANVPVTIARLPANGEGGWKLITTPSANKDGQYFTDANGVYTIKDLKREDGLVLKDESGASIAHINKKTGRITILDSHYELRVLPANNSGSPTRMAIYLKTEANTARPYSYSYIVPDVNTDVSVDSKLVEYTLKGADGFAGVHVKSLNNTIKFESVGAGDFKNPGAVVMKTGTGKRIGIVMVNGDILFEDAALALRVKVVEDSQKSNEPVVYELTFRNSLAAEILMAVNLAHPFPVDAEVISAPVAAQRARKVSKTKDQPFTDIAKTDPFNDTIKKLYERGIVAGYQTGKNGEAEYRPAQNIARSEFTQIIMKMLCIVPRPEAHKLPSPFFDVMNPNLWFYPVLKEGNIRGFIKGYLGEARRDFVTGALLTPFRPANSITRAEATTVVIAALDEEGIIDLRKADMRGRPGDQWYDPYLRVAQDLTPYLVNPLDTQTRAFLLTKEEAARATELITRRDFAVMAERVLLIRDCGNPDQDNDGMNDVWEREHQAENPNDDLDRDSCPNIREYEMGTDPRNADTDGGGTTDCIEIARGTNATGNPVDDDRTSEGIFIVDQGCGNQCPCRTSIQDASDLSSGDIIFAAISGPNGVPIYAKSNEEKR